MRKLIFLLLLLFPTFAFGQSYTGNYRAIFFNLLSDQKTIIVEFEVKTDNSLNGKIKVDSTFKDFSGKVDKKGKFEAVIEQLGNFTYKLKGKFDKENKISLVQRNQVDSGLNKSVSESSLEGTFAKVPATEKTVETTSNTQTLPKVEMIDNGKSWIKLDHANPLFGTDWKDFTAEIRFSKDNQYVEQEKADSFNLYVKSKNKNEQGINMFSRNYSPNQKIWKATDLRYFSYTERNNEHGNAFMLGGGLTDRPEYAGNMVEIVKETETQIVFKISNCKIRRGYNKQDFVVLNGFIYADKVKP